MLFPSENHDGYEVILERKKRANNLLGSSVGVMREDTYQLIYSFLAIIEFDKLWRGITFPKGIGSLSFYRLEYREYSGAKAVNRSSVNI
jgi:hypothetical protein